MNTENTLSRTGTFLYDAALILFLTQRIFRSTMLNYSVEEGMYMSLMHYLFLLPVLLLAVKVLFFQDVFHSSLMRSVPFWIVSALLAVSTWISRDITIFSVWIFVVAAPDTNFDSTVRITLYCEAALTLAIVLFSTAGPIPTQTFYSSGVGPHPFTRYSLGFVHPNSLGLYTFHIVSCLVYLRRNKPMLPSLLVLIAASVFNFFITNSRTSVMCSILLLLCMIVYRVLSTKKTEKREKAMKIFMRVLIAGSCLIMIFCLLLSLNYDIPLVQKLDHLLSLRFYYISNVFSAHSITWLGNPPFTIDGPFDNTYMLILLNNGILLYAAVSVLFIYLMIFLTSRKKYAEVILLFVYSCYAMMESNIFSVGKCVFILLFSVLLFTEPQEKKMELTGEDSPERV